MQTLAPLERQTPAAQWATRLTAITHLLRFPIAALLIVATVAGFIAGERIVYDPDVLVYFDEASPSRQAFDRVDTEFGRSQEVATLIVAPTGRTVFEPDALAVMAALAQASLARDEVAAVRSPLDTINVTPSAVLAGDEGARAEWVERLSDTPSVTGGAPLISADGTVAAVASIIPAVNDNSRVETLAAAHAALRDRVQATTDYELLQTGRLMIDAAFLKESRDDLNNFAGVQMGLLLALLLAAFGSLSLTIAVGVVALSAIGLTVGVLGTIQWPINGISSAAPAVLMGLAVASAVHVAGAWQSALRDGADKAEAVALALSRCGKPVALSLATTLLSFLVLNLAEAPPFRDLGNLVAAGLVGVLALTFLVLPAFLHLLPRSTARHRASFEAFLGNAAAALALRRRMTIILTTMAAIAAGVGVAAITIDDTFSHYFDKRYEIRKATDLFEAALSGTTIIDVFADTGGPGGALSADALDRTAEAVAWLAARPEVARTDSLAALRAELPPEALSQNEPVVLAAAAEAAALAGRPMMVSEDGRLTRISVVMRGVSSQDTLSFAADTKAALSPILGPSVAVTGLPVLSAELSVGSARAMVLGMAVALTAISLIIIVTLRSWRMGFISIVPNLLPVMLAFGLWGALVGEISFAATVVAALTYGIVVDDTVHILARYRTLTKSGADAIEAVRRTYATVGTAVVVTTLALALSFLPFALSGFLVNRHFGALTALTLVAALIVDLVLLPALLTRRSGQKTHPAPSELEPHDDRQPHHRPVPEL